MSESLTRHDETERSDSCLYINSCSFKGVNLTTLPMTGYPVLSGFYVLPEAYRAFLQQNDLEQSIAVIMAENKLSDPEQLPTCGPRIRRLIMEREFPNNIKTAILSAYWRLFRLPASGKLYVEVTPSVRIEDQPRSSFVGQPEGFGCIFGESDLLCAIKKCWALLWSDQAIAYRHTYHVDHTKISVMVLVQHKALLEICEILLSARS